MDLNKELEIKKQSFEALIASPKDEQGFIDYGLPYPKEEFLKYLIEAKGFLLHGSNRSMDSLEPRQANDELKLSGNKLAVYAVEDPVLPIFYSVLDKNKIQGLVVSGKRNNGHQVEYIFEIPKDAIKAHPWTKGIIYIVSKDKFIQEADDEGEAIEEWSSSEEVIPWGKLSVNKEDFRFLDQVKPLTE
jgi:hypothetical protein